MIASMTYFVFRSSESCDCTLRGLNRNRGQRTENNNFIIVYIKSLCIVKYTVFNKLKFLFSVPVPFIVRSPNIVFVNFYHVTYFDAENERRASVAVMYRHLKRMHLMVKNTLYQINSFHHSFAVLISSNSSVTSISY